MQSGLAVFGGTFDPVHFGHLRSAVEVADFLQLDSVCMLPASQPAHRESPLCSSEQRLAMLRLAVAEESLLKIDERECQRQGPSYMVDTLASLRAEHGADKPIVLVLGIDSFLTLPQWYRWQDIIGLAHILVLDRPGWDSNSDASSPALLHLLQEHEVNDKSLMLNSAQGCVLRTGLTQLNISASQIRQFIANGQSVRYLVPDSVVSFISNNGIYSTTAD